MLDDLKAWATTHWVLWPAVLCVLIVFLCILWWSRHQKHHSPALFRQMTTSLLLGLAVIAAGIIEDVPSWFRRSSVISCLGVLMIASALLSYIVAHRWVDDIASDHENKVKKELNTLKEQIGTKIGLLPPSK